MLIWAPLVLNHDNFRFFSMIHTLSLVLLYKQPKNLHTNWKFDFSLPIFSPVMILGPYLLLNHFPKLIVCMLILLVAKKGKILVVLGGHENHKLIYFQPGTKE